MALLQEELRLQQKQEILDLQIKLQKATAEEQAYVEIGKEKTNLICPPGWRSYLSL